MSDADTVAVVSGTGQLGFGLALRWAATQARVLIASRDVDRARNAAGRIRDKVGRHADVEAMSYEEATTESNFVVLAIPFDAHVTTLKRIREFLAPGAIVLDTTVPLATAVGGRPTRTLMLWQGSAAQQARELLKDRARIVAGMHTIAAETLNQWPESVNSDVFLVGDDREAKRFVGGWIERIDNLRAVDSGSLELARVTEQLTSLLISINKVHGVSATGLRVTGLVD